MKEVGIKRKLQTTNGRFQQITYSMDLSVCGVGRSENHGT